MSTDGWKTDFARHGVPLSEFPAWLGDREPVLAVEAGADCAHPVEISCGTRSSTTSSAAVFDRRLGGRVVTFGTPGTARRSDPDVSAPRPRSSSSVRVTGRATQGPLAGRRLTGHRHNQQFWCALAAFLRRRGSSRGSSDEAHPPG